MASCAVDLRVPLVNENWWHDNESSRAKVAQHGANHHDGLTEPHLVGNKAPTYAGNRV